MPTVKFSSETELIDELKKEFGNYSPAELKVKGAILRLSGLLKSTGTMPIRYLYVVATIKDTRGDILRLENYCGDIWGIGPEDKKTKDRAKEVEDRIEQTCKELGIEVRLGTFEA